MNKRDLAQQAATGNGEFRTKAVRAGHHRTGEGEHAEAMFMTSSFCFPMPNRPKPPLSMIAETTSTADSITRPCRPLRNDWRR